MTNPESQQDLKLIKEILANVMDESLVQQNAATLEKRYGKGAGTVTQMIFYSNFKNEFEILKELKGKEKDPK